MSIARAPVVAWGEVLWDRLPAGDALGGAPANVAWHLALLGVPVALASRVGDDDAGAEAARRLAARGVDTALLQRDAARATGEVTVTFSPDAPGEPRYRLVPGRAWEWIDADAAIRAAIAVAPALVFGTLSQRTPRGLAAWRAALAAAGPATLRVFDPNLRPGVDEPAIRDALADALAVADVVKLGAAELAEAQRRLGRPDLLDWLLGARRPAARLVAVTRGAAGATLHTVTGRLDVPAAAATPGGDAIGCGDAYCAVLTAGLVAGWPLPRLAAVAARWAARVASVRGATPDLDAAEVAALLAEAP